MVDNLTSLEILKSRFYKNMDNPDHAKNYAEAIHNCLNEKLIDPSEARKEYGIILAQFPRLYRIRNYIMETKSSLENTSINELNQVMEAVRDFYHRNPENEAVAEDYALSLWLLFEHPETNNQDELLELLSELINTFPENESIVDKYFKALDWEEDNIFSTAPKTITIHTTKKVLTQKDAELYADSLLSFTKRQNDLVELDKTHEKYKSLIKRFPSSDFIKECYAKTLYYYIDDSDELYYGAVLELLMELQLTSSSQQLAKIYAQALEECHSLNAGILDELKRLYEQFPNDEFIIDAYGFSLASYCNDNTNPKESRAYARGLFFELQRNNPLVITLNDYLQ